MAEAQVAREAPAEPLPEREPPADAFFELSILRGVDNVRAAMLILMLVVALSTPEYLGSRLAVYTALIVGVFLTLWTRYAARWDDLRTNGNLLNAAGVVLIGDIAWIGLFVWGTGGLYSPFLALLLLPIVFGSGFFGLLAYAVAIATGIVAMLNVAYAFAQPVNAAMTWRLLGSLFALLAVAWVSYTITLVLERERRTNELVIRHMSEAVILIDASGHIRLVNPPLERFTGLSMDDTIGLDVRDLPEDRQFDALRTITGTATDPDGAPVRSIEDIQVEADERLDLRIYAVRLGASGRGAGWLIICQDITDLKTIARARESGVRFLSHEIRSPLTTLKMISQVFGELAGRLTDDNTTRLVGILDEETDRMLRLVGQFLDLAALDQGSFQLELSEVEISETVRRVARSLELRAAEKSLSVQTELDEPLPPVHVDRNRMEDVLHNLCDNALKFTDPGGEVRLTAAQADGHVRVTVSDTGCGIPPETKDIIFEQFARAADEGQGNRERGIGLGLYLARRVVELHGGRIEVESEVGHGSDFSIYLPVSD
ncbi:MAG: ATP-binding protein [Armatimonadota bacterium]|nr:ATP-binding protein [Armatimonadota bacterium]